MMDEQRGGGEFTETNSPCAYTAFLFHFCLPQSLIRVLYIWAIRHPASGYVQGINDLAVPFLLVFLSTVAPGVCELNPFTPFSFPISFTHDLISFLSDERHWGYSSWRSFWWGLAEYGGRCLLVRPLTAHPSISHSSDHFTRRCVSNMLQGIQDHYTFAQPGIQRMVFKLRELLTRLDGY